MNIDTTAIINELGEKVNTIISLYENCKNENLSLKEEIEALKEKNNLQEKELDAIKNQYSTLQISKKISATGTNGEAIKNKINTVIKEIDKSIGYLNR
jgi:predicted  nucleic acid-binding Zn-ribbon protein